MLSRSGRDLVLVALLTFAPFALACGGGDDRGRDVTGGTEQEARPERSGDQRVKPPAPSPVSTPAEGESEAGPAVEQSVEPVVETPVVPETVTFAQAESLYHARRYDEAAAYFGVYVTDEPKNGWGHYMLGLSAWKAGDLELAEASLARTLELDSTHVKGRINLARVLLERQLPGEALEQVEKVLELEPESNVGYRLLGRVRNELGQTEAAIEAYRQAILLDDSDAWSMNNLGLIYIREGRFEDALGPLALATELRDDVAVFQNNLGIALERTGHPREAEDAFATALDIRADYEKARISLARVEGHGEEPEVGQVDLLTLAQAFREKVQSWREPEPVEPVETSAGLRGDESAGGESVAGESVDDEPVSDESVDDTPLRRR